MNRIVTRWDRRRPGSTVWHLGCVDCSRRPGEAHKTDCPKIRPRPQEHE